MSSDDSSTSLGKLKPGPKWSTTYAYLYLSLLVIAPVAIVAGLVATGVIQLDATVSVSADVGFVVEWLVAGVTIVFLFWTFVQVVRVTGIGFVSSVIDTVARIADAYQLPDRGDDE